MPHERQSYHYALDRIRKKRSSIRNNNTLLTTQAFRSCIARNSDLGKRHKHGFIKITMTFETLGLSEELLRAVRDTGYTSPTPIQAKAIPAILEGKDVMGAAQTGTGKTAGFTLPLLQLLGNKPPVKNNRVRALVLTPTRELAAQVQDSVFTYGKHIKLSSAVVFGGVKIKHY